MLIALHPFKTIFKIIFARGRWPTFYCLLCSSCTSSRSLWHPNPMVVLMPTLSSLAPPPASRKLVSWQLLDFSGPWWTYHSVQLSFLMIEPGDTSSLVTGSRQEHSLFLTHLPLVSLTAPLGQTQVLLSHAISARAQSVSPRTSEHVPGHRSAFSTCLQFLGISGGSQTVK